MRIQLSCVMLAGCLAGAAAADVIVNSGTLHWEGDSEGTGNGWYDEPLGPDAVEYYGNMVGAIWGGTNADPLHIEGWGGEDHYEYDGTDGSYGWMMYGWVQYDLSLTFQADTLLTGLGDLGFQLLNLDTNDLLEGSMDSISNGLVVAAGEYQLTVTDFGYGAGDSGSDSYEDDGTGEWYYESWSYYNYGGWMEITEVPAPGAIALFAIAGFARRRRRH